MKLYTHLDFGGDCEEAFRFYAGLLGGRITMMLKASELPPHVPRLHGSPDAASGRCGRSCTSGPAETS